MWQSTDREFIIGWFSTSVWRKHCLKAQRMAVKESTKYWENLRNFLLSSMSPCLRPLLACLLPTGLLSIWQVSFQTDLPSKKIYYFVDYCTALFSSPVIVVKVLKVTTSKQSICHCLISNWEGLGMSLCIMGYLKIWFSAGGVWVFLTFQSYVVILHCVFYHNWAICCTLIGQELWSIRVQTMKMKWRLWAICFLLSPAYNFPRNLNANGCQNCQCYCKKQINTNFPWLVLLLTVKMTSKCSKFCSENTSLQLVVLL